MGTQSLIFALIYFGFGFGLIFLAILIIRDSAKTRLNRITSIMLFLAGLGPIFAALGTVISPYQSGSPLKESYLYNLFYIWELFFPVLLYFSWKFPYDRLAGKKIGWRFLIFVPHVFHVILVVFVTDTDQLLSWLTIDPGNENWLTGLLDPILSVLQWLMLPVGLILASHKKFFALINLSYVIIAVIYLYRGMRHVKADRLKKQVRVIILGMHTSLGLYIFTFILPNLFAIEISELWTSLLTIFALVIGVGSIAWSIIRYQFLDIRLILRQSLVYTVSSAVLVGTYVIIISQFSAFLQSFFGQQLPLLNIGFIIIALILFQPINNYVDNIIKGLFIRDRSDYRNIMNRLSSRIINILDRRQLFKVVEDTLKSNMLVEGVSFSIYDDATKAYLYFPIGGKAESRLINTDPLLGAIGQLKAPTFYDRIESWQRGSSLATMMGADNIHMIVPLNQEEHLLGFMALTDKSSGFKFDYEDFTLLATLANQMIIALSNVRLYHESLGKQRLQEEMNLARQIQVDLLPDTPPKGKNYTICAHSEPSRTVGGDFYDFVLTDNDSGVGMVVADISGKGMPAALLAAQIQATLRSEVSNNREVSETLTNVNNIVSCLSSSSGKYATLFFGKFKPESGEFEFSNAGHNYPLLIRSNGNHEYLEAGGTVIGAFDDVMYQSVKVKLEPDDLLFLYTDGLSEAMNAKEEEYGENRILDYLVNNRGKTVEQIQAGILGEVREFSSVQGAEDDTTIVVLKVNGENGNE